ncbi:Uncharacterised protein [uncultured archaeon]|nr:Uncharacterised protein [uncultured archaeon]
MTKLRIVGGIPEIDGNPEEIVEILQKLNSSQLTSTNPPTKKADRLIFKTDVPDAEKIVEMTEASGRPFTLSMGEIGMKQFNRFITSNEDAEIYNSLRNEFDKAKKRLEKKYGGKWIREGIKVDGHPSMRYTLIEDQTPVDQTQTPTDQQRPLPQEEDVEVIKM